LIFSLALNCLNFKWPFCRRLMNLHLPAFRGK
jgi:hypothetical protein